MHHFVGSVLLEGEGVCTRDVGCLEGGARTVAGWYLDQGEVNKADKGAGDVDGDVLRTEEPGVVASVSDEELLLDASIRVDEGTAVWLDDGSDALVGRDDVETCEEVVVRESNDTFHGGK